jgi:hypothetical protein
MNQHFHVRMAKTAKVKFYLINNYTSDKNILARTAKWPKIHFSLYYNYNRHNSLSLAFLAVLT